MVALYETMGMTLIASRFFTGWRQVRNILIANNVTLRPHRVRWCHICGSQVSKESPIGAQWAAGHCDWYEGKCKTKESAEELKAFEQWRPTMKRRSYDLL